MEDKLLGTGVPLIHHQGASKSTGLGDPLEIAGQLESIKRHRLRGGKVEFQVRWRGASSHEDTWEPPSTFVRELSPPFLDYVRNNGLEECLKDLLPTE